MREKEENYKYVYMHEEKVKRKDEKTAANFKNLSD